MEVACEPIKTIHGLIDDIERYVRHYTSGRDVNERWFCAEKLEPILQIARQIRHTNLDAEHKRAVAAFRSGELAKELGRKQREVEQLERDLKLALRAAEATA